MVSNSVRMMAPVGQFSRQPGRWQCLHTSEWKIHEKAPSPVVCDSSGFSRSMKATWRQLEAPRCAVLSYDRPVKTRPSSGNWFHCLQATSHALQPMQTVVAVKKPLISESVAGIGGYSC